MFTAELNMTTPTNQLIRLGQLRQRAYALLSSQGHPANIADSASAALSVLHELASSPDTASDALALLHELQVHQVEIEMQSEDLRTSLTEADAALNHQVQYLDGIPVTCISIDACGKLLDINQTGARWLGLKREALRSQTLNAYMAPDSAVALRQQVSAIDLGQAPVSWHMVLLTEGQAPRPVLASVNADPTSEGRYILALMDVPASGPR